MTPAKKTRSVEPAELPALKRRLRFGAWQLAGVTVLGLIPVLAALKLFGAGQASAGALAGTLSLSVDYPPRIRYGTGETIVVLVTNTGVSRLDTVRVQFDSTYVARVSDPQFVPAASRAFEVELTGLAPGEVRRVDLGFYAKDYGRHRGIVAASHAGDSAQVMIATTVFP